MQLNEFQQKLIEENVELKKAYQLWLGQQLKLEELSARSNYQALKAKINQTKKRKEVRTMPESFQV